MLDTAETATLALPNGEGPMANGRFHAARDGLARIAASGMSVTGALAISRAAASRNRSRAAISAAVLMLALLTTPWNSPAHAAAPGDRIRVVDVELGPRGQWSGTVLDSAGNGVAGLMARLSSRRGSSVEFTTDTRGRFELAGLAPGVRVLEFGGAPRLYRFWKNGTAPPKSSRNSLIVLEQDVVRGVQGSRIYGWLSDHPALTYTGIAAAIVVPIVVVGSNQDEGPASP